MHINIWVARKHGPVVRGWPIPDFLPGNSFGLSGSSFPELSVVRHVSAHTASSTHGWLSLWWARVSWYLVEEALGMLWSHSSHSRGSQSQDWSVEDPSGCWPQEGAPSHSSWLSLILAGATRSGSIVSPPVPTPANHQATGWTSETILRALAPWQTWGEWGARASGMTKALGELASVAKWALCWGVGGLSSMHIHPSNNQLCPDCPWLLFIDAHECPHHPCFTPSHTFYSPISTSFVMKDVDPRNHAMSYPSQGICFTFSRSFWRPTAIIQWFSNLVCTKST